MSICLNMIVKNESKIIIRLLKSVYSIIDCFCICDTGSTDNTIDLINDFFKNKNIVGKVIKEPFQNFEHNRNVALEACAGMSEYILLLDADMIIVKNPEYKLELTLDAYFLDQGDNNNMGRNVRFVKNNGTFKYYGITHECIKTTTPNPTFENIEKDKLFINDIGDGGSKSDKYERDKRLLLSALETTPDNARYNFYLANTFRELNEKENAIKYYKIRIKLEDIDINKYTDEIWYCYYHIGILLNNEESIHYWLMAHKSTPKRIEHLYEIIKFYRLRKDYALCKIFYDIAAEIMKPPFKYSDVHKFIFISLIHYRYLLDYEYTLFSCYLDIKTADSNFVKIFNECDRQNLLDITLSNLKFYKNILKPVKIIEFTKTEIIGDYTMNHSTPCIIPYNDGYLMNIRCVNYSINDNCLYCNIGTNEKCSKIITFNKRLELSKDFKIINETIMIPNLTDNYIIGIEDIKPFKNFFNEIVFLGSSQHDYDSIGMNYGKYNDINNSNKIKPDFITHNREKNWTFIPNERNEIVYKWCPLTICNLNESVLKIDRLVDTPNIFKLVRGSSNGFLYKDEIWFITHFVSDEKCRYYYQLFVVFDINMNLQRYSPPFNFSDKPIEFCLSIIVNDDQVIIPYSVNDGSAIVSIYDKKMIDSFIYVIV